MFGIVWFVQIIHYPLFAIIDERNFSVFEKEHVRLTKYLIMPAMLIELGTAIYLAVFTISDLIFIYRMNLLMLIGIWASTFFIQVPLHSLLSSIKDKIVIKKLVRSNWIRTILWTLRLLLLFWILIFIS